MKLNSLRAGDVATVSSFSALSGQIKKKLMVMGVLPETEVKLVRKAPMGDPLQVEVRGESLALSSNIASEIDVEMK
ncbi:ferrous iron transport protein A [Vibrio sp. JC009]|uniref:FeoA family protein n=1 Tax=Vibrio sp. JC009 TaxID=2912314 RepID=UPI0023AFF731|nr:FeoA family protein [Vibrio sp. JC009]WED24017.1 ferrous iron transport protein A [Vibrio sp. JC009]